jgi:hypothetical protein
MQAELSLAPGSRRKNPEGLSSDDAKRTSMTNTTPLSLSHIPAGSPWWVFAAVVLVLALHIGAENAGIVSVYSALFVRKGGRVQPYSDPRVLNEIAV